jgi:protein-tyrosine-phosphatase
VTAIRSVLVLCTGNATRSVLAGELLRRRRPDLAVETAGTLSVDGRPVSWRTRAAFEAIGLPVPEHTSAQATLDHVERADLLLGAAPEHVAWVRREHPDASARAVTLRRLDRLDEPIGTWLASGAAATVELAGWEEVVDPGGGEVDDFVACAREIEVLVARVAPRL